MQGVYGKPGLKILYFAPIAYRDLKQRPQFLAEQLSRGNEVSYIEPTISIFKYLSSRSADYRKAAYDVSPNLHILRLSGACTAYRSLELFDFLRLNTVSERLQLRSLLSGCDVVWVGYAPWYHVVSAVKGKKIIYDKMDENSLLAGNSLLRRLIHKTEPLLIQKADCVFVTAKIFYDAIKKQNPNTILLPNAVSSDVLVPIQKKSDPGKRVFGYVGTIGRWFDFQAVQSILDADERNYVVLAGPGGQGGMQHPRLTYLGTVPHGEVFGLIRTFDVCLYPFRRNELLDTIDPVKIYEYLAMNKPVLAVRSRETEKFASLAVLYDNAGENLKDSARADFKAPFRHEEERVRFLRENCWAARFEIIKKALGAT